MESDAPLALRQIAYEDLLTILLDFVALSFYGSLIFVEEGAGIQVLPFHQSLNRGGIVSIMRNDVAVLHHEIVLQRDEETRAAGVALASSAPTELIVDAPALMLIRADYVQASQLRDSSAELDVRSTARHIGRD